MISEVNVQLGKWIVYTHCRWQCFITTNSTQTFQCDKCPGTRLWVCSTAAFVCRSTSVLCQTAGQCQDVREWWQWTQDTCDLRLQSHQQLNLNITSATSRQNKVMKHERQLHFSKSPKEATMQSDKNNLLASFDVWLIKPDSFQPSKSSKSICHLLEPIANDAANWLHNIF